MHFGFSYVGLIFLLMLFVPNFFWTKNKPKDYERYAGNENRVLLALERAGEAAVSCLVLIFRDFDPQGWEPRLLWLGAALLLMGLYEFFWIRYFRSGKTMKDFYRGVLGIPVAGATLPVLAVLCLAAYGRNPLLFGAGIVLGIGHVGIHLAHRREAEEALPAYDPEREKPVVRASVCTPEQAAGFRDRETGAFREVLLIRTPEDLDRFRKAYGLDHVDVEY